MTDKKGGRPPLPEDKKRVRLAGGPTVEPPTLNWITMMSNNNGMSIGKVLDFLVWSYMNYHKGLEAWRKEKEADNDN